MSSSSAEIVTAARELLPELVAIRRELHQIPEVGLTLPQTQAVVLRELDGLPLEISTGTDTTSVVALLRGAHPGPTVLLRGDMDGLPVTEVNDLPYRATNGNMHACGHDLHTTGLIGAARLLSARRDQLHGSVIFMFQPGEEGYNGASVMLREGVLNATGETPIAAYALHVGPGPLGQVETKSGTILAGSSELEITVRGSGGHGSQPHTALDPVLPLAEITVALQSMVTRRFDVFDPVVISVTQLRAGDALNVIPEQATLGATVRTMSAETLEALPGMITDLAEGIARGYGCEADVTFTTQYIPTVNDDSEHAFAVEQIHQMYGEDSVTIKPHGIMGSEDFSFVLAEVPGAFMMVKCSPPEEDPATLAYNHSPHVLFDDSVLDRVAGILAQLAIARLAAA
ncbi:M20 family metallopeptidase [Microbacterium sp. NC79]|uniref:M20 metallopeptidase family protein n=1 Tax=Microbacterium sp. NC79 TaxID=2851009 RepID=UPI001C2C356B|nr:M20 family metallopeptidase [Microbacterium sp. NC79]MBV0894452.1 amidohydrolase [Microbacterium sp. NC79]